MHVASGWGYVTCQCPSCKGVRSILVWFSTCCPPGFIEGKFPPKHRKCHWQVSIGQKERQLLITLRYICCCFNALIPSKEIWPKMRRIKVHHTIPYHAITYHTLPYHTKNISKILSLLSLNLSLLCTGIFLNDFLINLFIVVSDIF